MTTEKGVGAVVWGLGENQNQQSVRGQVLRGGVCFRTGRDSWGIIQSVCVCVLQLPLALDPYAPAYVFSTLILKTSLNSSGRHYHQYIQSCLIISNICESHDLPFYHMFIR
jgi:hypothetical protein